MNLVWVAGLQILGLALLAAEVFFPSFGLLSLAMAASVGVSLWLVFDQGLLFWILLGVDIVLFPLLGWYLMRFVGAGPLGLPEQLEAGNGMVVAICNGQVGTALTDLRPAGKARLQGEIVDVVSDGQFLNKGCDLFVVDARQNRIVVRAARPGETSPGA
jgi:membrane-bound serine protease (ClpP class)